VINNVQSTAGNTQRHRACCWPKFWPINMILAGEMPEQRAIISFQLKMTAKQ